VSLPKGKQYNRLFIQRLGLFLYLAAGVLLLIYALGFITNEYIFYAYGSKGLEDFYNEMQTVNAGLLWKAIVLIIFALILFILELRKHPAGIITLIITVFIVALSIFLCIDSLIILAQTKAEYSSLDFSSLSRYIERGTIKYQYSTLTFNLGFGGYFLFLLSSVFLLIIVIRNALLIKDNE